MTVSKTPTGNTDVLLADLIDEIMQKQRRGEPVSLADYAAEYPDHVQQLQELLPALRALDDLSQSSCRDGGSRSRAPGEASREGEEKAFRGGTLGDFRILGEIGRGGMGVVYEAEQISLHRRVALKILPFAAVLDPRHLQRFKNEAVAAASLKHPSIVSVYAVGRERGVHFYAMEYVEGRTLAQVIDQLREAGGTPKTERTLPATTPLAPEPRTLNPAGPARPGSEPSPLAPHPSPLAPHPSPLAPSSLPLAAVSTQRSHRTPEFFRSVANLGIQAAEALEHAHQMGVVHRDIKPSNLMVDARGQLWITDFGLAQISAPSPLRGESRGEGASLTMTGDILGTLRYMSPEQAAGKSRVLDHHTDIYSLGLTLYELLTLHPAFEGDDRQRLLCRIVADDPPPPRQHNPSIPRDLETIVLKATAKEPNSRYATAQALADDLRRYLDDQPIRARRPSLAQRASKWFRRHKPVAWSVAGLLVFAMLALTASSILLSRKQLEIAEQRDQAESERARAEANLRLAMEAVDKMYVRMAESHASRGPGVKPWERDLEQYALSFYQQFAEHNKSDAALEYEIAKAYDRIGVIQLRSNKNAEARAAYEKAIPLFEGLAARDPANVDFRAGLGTCWSNLGLAWEDIGKVQEAEAAFRKGLAVLESLDRDFPDVGRFRLSLIRVYGNLGRLLSHAGSIDQAEALYRRALAVSEALARKFPDHVDGQIGLGMAHDKLGNLFRWTFRPVEGEQHTRRAAEIWERLATRFPDELDYRHYLAATLNELGIVLAVTDRSKEAEAALRRSLAESEKIAQEFPAEPGYQLRAATSRTDLGRFLLDRGRFAEAEATSRCALESMSKLAATYPDVPGYAHGVGMILNNLGTLARDQGRLAEARRTLEESIRRHRAALKANPHHPHVLQTACDAYGGLSDTLLRMGNYSQAADAALELPRVAPNDWESHYQASRYLERCALLAQQDANRPEAERKALSQAYADRASRLRTEAFQRIPASSVGASVSNNLAWELATAADPKVRRPAEALGLAKKAVGLAPKDGCFWNTLGVAQYRAGDRKGAIESLGKSMESSSGGSPIDWFFLAMAHWQLKHTEEARKWYDKAAQWMEQKKPQGEALEEIVRFRDEAQELLGIGGRAESKKPEAKRPEAAKEKSGRK